MAFTSLAALRLALSNELQTGSQIADATLDDKIKLGENKVNKRLRVREMETALAATVGSDGTADVPADYLELKFSYMNTNPVRRLERKTPEWIYDHYPNRSAGVEKFVAREGANFIFGEAGTENRVMKGIYYAKPTAMASTINAVFSAYPECYFYASLSECESLLGRDSRIAVWEGRFEQAIASANAQDKDEGLSGGPLAATPG